MKKRIKAVALGLLGGYLAYLPVMLVYEKWTYGRWDFEKVFWALFCPLLSPQLVSPSFRKSLGIDEALLVPVGGAFLHLAVSLSLWRARERRVGGRVATTRPPTQKHRKECRGTTQNPQNLPAVSSLIVVSSLSVQPDASIGAPLRRTNGSHKNAAQRALYALSHGAHKISNRASLKCREPELPCDVQSL